MSFSEAHELFVEGNIDLEGFWVIWAGVKVVPTSFQLSPQNQSLTLHEMNILKGEMHIHESKTVDQAL